MKSNKPVTTLHTSENFTIAGRAQVRTMTCPIKINGKVAKYSQLVAKEEQSEEPALLHRSSKRRTGQRGATHRRHLVGSKSHRRYLLNR